MANYLVVLFKDKKRKRIIKKFITFAKAKQYFDKLINESKEVIFDVLYENGHECKYELGIVEMSDKQLVPVYITDEMGRNVKVKLEESGMTLFMISTYKKEELIYDLQKNKKITVKQFLFDYMRNDEMKMVSSINNKIVVQKDDECYLFSLKNHNEALRFIDCLSQLFFKEKKSNCLFVKDNSKAQRKYLIDLLSKKGIDKKILYRKSTTHPSPRLK